MKKKKIKKKKKAKAKPKAPRRRKRTDPLIDILAKIDRIKKRVPYIEPTGECCDENTGEVLFRFTEAQHVFEVYREQCDLEKLHFRAYIDGSIQPKVVAIGSMPCLIGTFCIEDLETGYRLVGFGTGMGANRDWSGNTASTRALKQFLLTTFEPTWKDPEKLSGKAEKEQLRREVIQELEADGTLARIDQLKFWGKQFPEKGKQDVTDTKRKDTKKRKRTNRKKD